MLQIADTLISLDIIEKKFVCDIPKCFGNCCIYGDSGAPLEKTEAKLIKKQYEKIKPYLTPEGIKAIEISGTSVIDSDGDLVTPLIEKKECAYIVFNNGIATCGIELAYENGDSSLQKPISCHLYPIRLKKYPTFTAVNYDSWDICKPALLLGQKENLPLYKYLKAPLIRKFGKAWYKELEMAAESLEDDMGKKN
ncbi:MAG: DUF3109 family protein [Bacteroidota bacterium]|nr:DUF3109 family protein [Bacteroidota bacterium]